MIPRSRRHHDGGVIDRSWLEAMRHIPVLEVAAAFGRRIRPPKGASGGCIYGCPACGAQRRHSKARDRRGALGVRRDGRGFKCMQCGITGDAIDLASLLLTGKRCRDLHHSEHAQMQAWCKRLIGAPLTTAPHPPPVEEPPRYPPQQEVERLSRSCGRVDLDPDAAAYLRSRHIDPVRVADVHLAGALPRKAPLPPWASVSGRPWNETGHRLIVPLYDCRGVLRSVLARCIQAAAERKSTAPAGFARAGLIMACALGRQVLCAGEKPQWWPPGCTLCAVIAEGEIDWLLWATQCSDAAECALLAFGIVTGAWGAEFAARLPDGTRLVIATDADPDGERLAGDILGTLTGRSLEVERLRPSEVAS